MLDEAETTAFSPRQQVALAIVPKFSCALSLIGSGWIILEVLRDRRKLGLVYHRLMMQMSFWNVVSSSAKFLSTWPMPVDTPNVFGAVGNTATCTAQGFFVQLGVTQSFVYQAFLATYYLLVLRYNWKERRIQKLERSAITFCGLLGFSTAIAGLPLTLYNSANFWCWIAALGCEGGSGDGREKSCVRGTNAWIYRYAFAFVWGWLALLVVVVAMVLVYWTVHQQSEKAKRYSVGGALAQKKKRVAFQAIYYILSYLFLALFASMTRLIQNSTGKTYFSLSLLMVISDPLQGFFNGVIYLRPRYMGYRSANPSWSIRTVVTKVLLRTVRRQTDSKAMGDDDHKLGNIELDATLTAVTSVATGDANGSLVEGGGQPS